jgi:hypothetical protein
MSGTDVDMLYGHEDEQPGSGDVRPWHYRIHDMT